MANKIQYIDNVSGDHVFPVTHERGVLDDNGVSVGTKITQLAQKVGAIVSVTEDGWFLTDEQLNAVLKYDADGLDAARVSEHFKSLFGGFIQVIESGIYFVDEQMNIGAKLTTDGFFAKNLMLYEII